MQVVIVVPQAFAASVAARVAAHRGQLHSSEHCDGEQRICTHVPHAEVAAFVSEVLADTNNQVRTSMTLLEYRTTLERPPGDPTAGVREPRPKVPSLRSGRIAVPEPEPADDEH